ncbi:MAG: LytTR family transcriptional regulator [Bacteroidales bacterium]|nr:LytTR family transcriptional regulator [Bacteroidales bacterium]
MDKQQPLREETRYQLKLIAGISLGMFLFMLFFIPFEFRDLGFNDRLLFIIGMGIICFIIMGVFRIILPSSLNEIIKLDTYKISNEVLTILLIWVFNALAYIFYLRFVGLLELSLFTVFKIVLFASFPSVILKLADVNKSLRDQLKHIVGKNVRLEKQVMDKDVVVRHTEIFSSDSLTDKIEIHPDDIMLVKSADNYINIIYKDGEEVKQKMLRNTLKHIHVQLRKHPEFIRCHRTCIINSLYIVNLTNNYKGYRLHLLDYAEEIPVSRQYILAVKEYMDSE